MVLRNLLLVPWMWCRLCYHAAHPDKYSLEEHFKMLRFVVQRANKGGNVIVESYGAENLPEQDGFVMYPNHQGLYDVLAIAGACSRTFTVVEMCIRDSCKYCVFLSGGPEYHQKWSCGAPAFPG